MVDEAAAFTTPYCVHGYDVYQRVWTPFVGGIVATVRDPVTQVIAMQNNAHAAHCAAIWCCSYTLGNTACNFSNFASIYANVFSNLRPVRTCTRIHIGSGSDLHQSCLH